MNIQENFDLTPFNTFGMQVHAAFFCKIETEEELQELIGLPVYKLNQVLVLGGGSNILFTNNFPGLVIHNSIQGMNVVAHDSEFVRIRVGGGVTWDTLVEFCVAHNFGGIENLSLIPGTCGAAPVQNIGAYGVELCDVLESIAMVDLQTGLLREVDAASCKFGYRDSIFKNEWKGRYFITGIIIRLTKGNHQYKTSYGAISGVLAAQNQEVSLSSIRSAVIQIRKSKLPDPKVIGNAGSFFKNPTITLAHFEELRLKFPDLTGFPMEDGGVKVAAGWLIERCEWKGKRVGGAGVHSQQALVLVNADHADGKEIVALSKLIIDDVSKKFGIVLHPEVNII